MSRSSAPPSVPTVGRAEGEAATIYQTPGADWWDVWQTSVNAILMVSDTRTWCSDVAAALGSEGYAVLVDGWGASAREAALPFDLIMVDLGLPELTAPAVIAEIRSRNTLPILAVAPPAAREAVVLDALAAGADQCVRQTAGPREVLARVRAILRRCPPQPRVIDLRCATVGTISVDVATMAAVVDGVKIELTARECDVLYALMRQPGRVVTREALEPDTSTARNERDLDSVVRRLRLKLETVDDRRRITTVRGVGFRFEA